MNADLYEVLGVSRDADGAAIKAAYRKLALEFHPDRNPGDKHAEERFKEITRAYGVLTDPGKRSAYDRTGSPDGMPDMSDFFGGFGMDDALRSFREMFGFGGGSGRSQRGSDIMMHLDLELSEAALGTVKEISVTRSEHCSICDGSGADPEHGLIPCPDCDGRGRVRSLRRTVLGTFQSVSDCPACEGTGRIPKVSCEHCRGTGLETRERKVKLDIPAGISAGHYIKHRGLGHFPPGGGDPGDLVMKVESIDYGDFIRDGDDLIYRIRISFPQAALGTTVEIPTVENESLSIDIPAGIQPMEKLVLKRRGMKRLQRMGRGSIVVVPEVFVPRKLSRKEKKILQELSETDSFKSD